MSRGVASLYHRVLGPEWGRLAEPLRVLHGSSAVRARGRLQVERGRHPFARASAALMRLPRAAASVETLLVITRDDEGERWIRTFGDRRLDTRQYLLADGVLAERFGALECRFHLEASAGSLVFRQVAATLMTGRLRVPLPSMFAPVVDAREDPLGVRRIAVTVRVEVPAGGRVLSYDGVIDVEESHP